MLPPAPPHPRRRGPARRLPRDGFGDVDGNRDSQGTHPAPRHPPRPRRTPAEPHTARPRATGCALASNTTRQPACRAGIQRRAGAARIQRQRTRRPSCAGRRRARHLQNQTPPPSSGASCRAGRRLTLSTPCASLPVSQSGASRSVSVREFGSLQPRAVLKRAGQTVLNRNVRVSSRATLGVRQRRRRPRRARRSVRWGDRP